MPAHQYHPPPHHHFQSHHRHHLRRRPPSGAGQPQAKNCRAAATAERGHQEESGEGHHLRGREEAVTVII